MEGPPSLSRAGTPPNEASYEDRIAFAWNPRSKRISRADKVHIHPSHVLSQTHDSRHDLTEAKFADLKSCWSNSNVIRGEELHLPSLRVANILLHLYFRHFQHQAPVLHPRTVDVNQDLPIHLVAIMIVIGAIYSRQRNARRFAILAWDRTRQGLLQAIETNDSLIREPHIIFALALICDTGLWCGNKRCFELSEALRGVVTSYMRRLPDHDLPCHDNRNLGGKQSQGPSVDSAWRTWTAIESRKRLKWYVFCLDSEFPTLLNLPPMLSLAEVTRYECPCDEEYWETPNARHWRNSLGAASVPPSRAFAAAIARFLQVQDDGDEGSASLSLNPWSAYLVLSAIFAQVHREIEDLRHVLHSAEDPDTEMSRESDSFLASHKRKHMGKFCVARHHFLYLTNSLQTVWTYGGDFTAYRGHQTSRIRATLTFELSALVFSSSPRSPSISPSPMFRERSGRLEMRTSSLLWRDCGGASSKTFIIALP